MNDNPEAAAAAVRPTQVVTNVYLHLPDPLKIELSPLTVNVQHPRREGQPVTAVLTIGGSFMPATISIDSTGQASIFWIDDKGNTDALQPEGAQVEFVSLNPEIGTADAAGLITPVAEGTGQVSANITGPDGGPLLEPDGVTPFAVSPADFTVVAGAAVGVSLEVKPS